MGDSTHRLTVVSVDKYHIQAGGDLWVTALTD